MPSYTQEHRPLAVNTPLGQDALILVEFAAHEAISELFRMELLMVSEKESIAPADIVGKNVTIWIRKLDDGDRYFNGFVSRFTYAGKSDRLSHYKAEVVPGAWFLTRTTDCRVFQKQDVPSIIKQVFSDRGFSDFDAGGIVKQHPKRDYCVQYRESDFDFVSRLMQEEGIFYFFRHENGRHVMVLADSKDAYEDCAENEVDFSAPLGAPVLSDLLTSWQHSYQFRSGKQALNDYNFETPTTNLLAKKSTVVQLPGLTKHELYDYPGEYINKSDGDGLAVTRLEIEEAAYDIAQGSSKCRTWTPGGKFMLKEHHGPAEQNKGYVITSISHSIRLAGGYTSGGGTQAEEYENSFTAIPDSVVFRPQRVTPRPMIHGIQTALVVGPSGQEIYTDKYGRIKVQFYWDREGKKNENSSCWIRVAQAWAGRRWGAGFWPRIGQEVVVAFLEGDPDRPLIVGSVYNAGQMPPYQGDGPDGKHASDNKVSGIKSNSTPGGQGFNELRFDDTKGKEQIFIHAQHNQDIRVKNDAYEIVGNDRHAIVKKNDLEQVDGDKNLTVKGNQNEKVDGTISAEAGMNLQQKVGVNHALEAGMQIHLKAGGTVVIEAGMQLTLKAGASFIDIGPAGIAISGSPLVMINSGGAAGSGSGCSPTAPTAPQEADDSKTGSKSAG